MPVASRAGIAEGEVPGISETGRTGRELYVELAGRAERNEDERHRQLMGAHEEAAAASAAQAAAAADLAAAIADLAECLKGRADLTRGKEWGSDAAGPLFPARRRPSLRCRGGARRAADGPVRCGAAAGRAGAARATAPAPVPYTHPRVRAAVPAPQGSHLLSRAPQACRCG